MKTFWRRDSPELKLTVVVRFTNSTDTAGEKAAMVDTDREEQGDPLVGVRSSPSCDTSLGTVERLQERTAMLLISEFRRHRSHQKTQ